MSDKKFKYLGSVICPDMLTPFEDDRRKKAATVNLHDCRTDPNRTGNCREIIIANSDETAWVFDTMHQGHMLFMVDFCPYCGIRLEESLTSVQ